MGERLHEYHNRVEESRRTLVSQVEGRTKDLKQAKEEAEAANKAKSDFLANMSHELRTPLNHIIGFTELVTEEHFGELNPTQKEYLTDALQGSQHLLSLINDILDISKVEAGKMELRAAPIELPVLISNSLIMIKEKALKHSIKVTADLEQLPATIQADGRKLKQVMYNLLSNAEKFTPEKGAIQVMGSMATITDGSVQTSDGRQIPLPVLNGKDASGKRSFARIAVQDTGIGLAADKLDLIFGAFDQVETSRSRMFQGTGLGLALTKRFVELHGGTIWAESEGKGKGCRLIFVLPAEG
jgi:signal transduction histidine kinase